MPVSKTRMVLSVERKTQLLMTELSLTETTASGLLRRGLTKRKQNHGREQAMYRYEILESVMLVPDSAFHDLEDPEDAATEDDMSDDGDLG